MVLCPFHFTNTHTHTYLQYIPFTYTLFYACIPALHTSRHISIHTCTYTLVRTLSHEHLLPPLSLKLIYMYVNEKIKCAVPKEKCENPVHVHVRMCLVFVYHYCIFIFLPSQSCTLIYMYIHIKLCTHAYVPSPSLPLSIPLSLPSIPPSPHSPFLSLYVCTCVYTNLR